MTTKPKITRTDANNNPWYQFLLETIKLDGSMYRQGEHWFMAVFYLHRLNRFPNFELEEVGKIVQSGHLVKKSFNTKLPHALALILQTLEQQLGNPKEIKKIDFSGLSFDEKTNFSRFIFPVEVSFEKAEFAGDVHFNDAVFCGNVSFDEAIFHNDSRFEKTVFFRDIRFADAAFSRNTIFNDAVFCQSVHFNDATISNDAYFNRATFSNINNFFSIADFTNTTFSGNVIFDNAKIFGYIKFYKVKFYGSAHFIKSELSGDIDFIDAKFKGNGVFLDTTFSINERLPKNLKFTNAIFSSGATFENATFAGSAFFEKVKFKRGTRFSKAIFSEKVDFSEAHFFEKSDFSDVNFLNGALFYKAKFSGDTNFNDTKFKEIAVFTESTFSDFALFYRINVASANFIGAHFKNRVPHFYDAKMGADIIWDKNSKLWPQIDWSNIYDDYKALMSDSQNAYENLTSHMKKLDKYHDEHFFYRQEMRCRRWLERNPCISFSYWLYEKLSDNGYGIGHALFWWFVHILLGAIFIFDRTKSACNKSCDLIDNFYFDVVVSFANAHGVLFFSRGPLKEYYEELKLVTGFNVIWGIQTIIGILLLFMLLLTLRIRFRLK